MGIPADDDFDVYNTLPGWDYKVRNYLIINKQFTYKYDYGDGWEHLIEYEGPHEKKPNCKYPLCIAGERACPPEDVGGVGGYYNFVATIKNPNHKEHDEMLEWVGGKFDPNYFDVNKVKFDNPTRRVFALTNCEKASNTRKHKCLMKCF